MNPVLLIQENPFLLNVYRKLSSVVKIVPYVLMEERYVEELEPAIHPSIDNLIFVRLNRNDILEIASHKEVLKSADSMLANLKEGTICLGLKHNGKIVSYTWCNLEVCSFKNWKMKLNSDEAYLYDIRTFESYRGMNLAPYLRYELYKLLVDQGRTRFYSISLLANVSSFKFKEKLGAKRIKKKVYISFFAAI
jgi:hypothetical protein